MGHGGERRRLRAYDGELGQAVARAQDGDEAAFAVAYRMVQPSLLGYVRLFGVDPDSELRVTAALHRMLGDRRTARGEGAEGTE